MHVLFVGPAGFNVNSWKTRADYILPDLFSSLIGDFSISLLTGPVPDFAVQSLKDLCARFSINHIEIGNLGKYGIGDDRWTGAVIATSNRIRPDVITNSLGSLRLGKAIGDGAKACGGRSVIRIAGDEIGSRIAMGKYLNDSSLLLADKALEHAGFIQADSIIAMSPWERLRIRSVLDVDSNKVKVCIRGVDCARFYPPASAGQFPVKRFLYVGRKSLEKGYDIIEAAAKIVFRWNPNIEFVFVGDFESSHVENRTYLGWVNACDLSDLYRSVDAFVLTSRTEGFPQVVAEAMASGLPCVLSSHLFATVFKHRTDVLLTDLDPEDVANQVISLASDQELTTQLRIRSREIAITSLDHLYWRERYLNILAGKKTDGVSILDITDTSEVCSGSSVNFITGNDEATKKMRVALLLPRALGALGTPGSYNLAESLHRHVELSVISNSAADNRSDVEIVSTISSDISIKKINFNKPNHCDLILDEFRNFNPDIVHVVNWHGWVTDIPKLKQEYPSPKYVIDFKTPLMAEGDKRAHLQIEGERASRLVDLVASRNSEDVDTWIQNNRAPVLVYPLGIPLASLHCRPIETDDVRRCTRFVYVGSLHPKRKIETLLRLVAALPDDLKVQMSLDFYGAGDDLGALNELVEHLGLTDRVRFCGTLPQSQLFLALAEYDAGIAWVPRELYDAAPSIKFLEYIGSGLVVLATDTLAHRRNVDAGFDALLFSENINSFTEAIRSSVDFGFPLRKVKKNLQMIKKYSWDRIVLDSFIPAYLWLIESPNPTDPYQAWMRRCKLNRISIVQTPTTTHRQAIERERFLHANRTSLNNVQLRK